MNILMVCLGNICRSPMAEGIMRKKLNDHQLIGTVDSCGTANYHVGESPDSRAVKKAQKYGIDISELVGRQLSVKDFDHFDRIYVMDASNYQNALKLTRNNEDKDKLKLILEELYPRSGMSVPDPYYGGDEGFENVYRLLEAACEKICSDLKI
jgi:protein-tyrosine phosphatase